MYMLVSWKHICWDYCCYFGREGACLVRAKRDSKDKLTWKRKSSCRNENRTGPTEQTIPLALSFCLIRTLSVLQTNSWEPDWCLKHYSFASHRFSFRIQVQVMQLLQVRVRDGNYTRIPMANSGPEHIVKCAMAVATWRRHLSRGAGFLLASVVFVVLFTGIQTSIEWFFLVAILLLL